MFHFIVTKSYISTGGGGVGVLFFSSCTAPKDKMTLSGVDINPKKETFCVNMPLK